MALLERMSISGIRSFGPNGEEKIKFSTPLTLILGQNGCGKTTIIECLKYALTGVLPSGTSTGSGFINDPKLSNKRSTKGAVKVKFKDCRGDLITVGRFAEVTVTKEGLRFKSINPSIRWEDGAGSGRKEDIGGRCADIDMYCFQKLNVSKAILHHVIFCHQEYSAWPLEEGKKVKEIFDQIFGSEKYNKAVDKLRKTFSAKKETIKQLKEQLKNKHLIREQAHSLKNDLESSNEKLNDIQQKVEQKNNDLKSLDVELDKICTLENALNDLQKNLMGLQNTFEATQKRQENLKADVKEEYQGSDEDLQSEITNFHNNQDKIEQTITEMEEKKQKLDVALRKVDQELQMLQIDFGKMKAEEDIYKKIQVELSEQIQKTRITLNVASDNDEPTKESLGKLTEALKIEESNFNSSKNEKENNEKKLQEQVDKIRDAYTVENERLSSKKEAIDDCSKKIGEFQDKLNAFSLGNTRADEVCEQIKDLQTDLAKLRSEFDESTEHLQIETLEQQIAMKNQRMETLDREYKVLKGNSITEQNIEKDKNTIAEKKAEIETMHRKNDGKFKMLFGNDLPSKNFESLLTKIFKMQDLKIKNIDKNISTTERKVISLEANVKHTREKLKTSKGELEMKKKQIFSKCKGKDFSEVLNQSHTKKEELTKDRGTYRSAKSLFDQFIAKFKEETPCCPICETNFADKKSRVSSIITNLEARIEEIPSKLHSIESDLKKENELFNSLQQLKPTNDEIKKLETETIPTLEMQLKEEEDSLDDAKMNLVALKQDRKHPEQLLETYRAVNRDAVLLDRLIMDVDDTEKSLGSLQQQLVQVPSNRTLKEVETELEQLKKDLSNLRRDHKTKRDSFDDFKGQIHSVLMLIQAKTQAKLDLQAALQEQPLLEKQIEEYKQKIQDLEIEISEAEENIQSLKFDLAEAQSNHEEAVKSNKKSIEETRKKLEDHRWSVTEISKKYDNALKYQNSGNESKLKTIQINIQEKKSNIVKVQDAQKVLSDRLVTRKNELVSQESKLRALKDNKELRENRREIQRLQKEINELNTKIGKHNNKSIMKEKRDLINRVDLINSEINQKIGQQDNLKEHIEKTKKELNVEKYKEADKEYRKKAYELKTEILAVEDLENYTCVFENSILKFHQEKMIHINMTIRDLWRNIYKGNDIDYIEIQTDGEIGKGGSKRRSYNYKVMQVKRGIALEMRGRCSAGQKVLACLVIRMALAETFSSNCGILALDEPTTNLDRENIGSLCDALSQIITTRQQFSSFQLIVITHDEDFLQTLTRNQSITHYYRVQRNTEGFSEIKKQVL